MALALPSYIQVANIQDQNIRYLWDDWNEEQAEEPIDEDFRARLKSLSQRAIIAFTAATAEWIVHRFAVLSNDPLPLQYLEAAWAMMVDLRYCRVTWDDYTQESKGWDGPIRRPSAMAMVRVEYAIKATIEYGDLENAAAWITNLAQYVLTDPTPYQIWREQIMERLESLYPLNREARLGQVVPREAVDPNFPFHPEETETLINMYLASLNYQGNPFLMSPEHMLELGFEGTPYVFSIEEDRKDRSDW